MKCWTHPRPGGAHLRASVASLALSIILNYREDANSRELADTANGADMANGNTLFYLICLIRRIYLPGTRICAASVASLALASFYLTAGRARQSLSRRTISDGPAARSAGPASGQYRTVRRRVPRGPYRDKSGRWKGSFPTTLQLYEAQSDIFLSNLSLSACKFLKACYIYSI